MTKFDVIEGNIYHGINNFHNTICEIILMGERHVKSNYYFCTFKYWKYKLYEE
jgi:hypothetical protein